MNTPQRRGACPGLSAPMATGDGLLVRFTAENSISLDAFIALAAAARRYGNGTIEVSARGSLQVRGLSPRSAPAFARALHALDIPAVDGTNVIADPLPDDPDVVIDTTGLAGTLRRALAAARLALAPKVCVTLDGGGHLHLDELSADLRLRAIGPAQAPRLHISVGGDATSATPLGLIPPRAAADTAVALLGAIALHGADARALMFFATEEASLSARPLMTLRPRRSCPRARLPSRSAGIRCGTAPSRLELLWRSVMPMRMRFRGSLASPAHMVRARCGLRPIARFCCSASRARTSITSLRRSSARASSCAPTIRAVGSSPVRASPPARRD